MKKINICYIGGGSKNWARVFMTDLALEEGLGGTISLYDIDLPAAQRNAQIGERINGHPNCKSKFNYKVCEQLDEALVGADFVILSILPGTFDQMHSDVHCPEQFGIYQSVGDTVGPGGVLRAMRTIPLYEQFATKIKAICPDAWVINLTNPMSVCVKTLYDVFPQIKAFGCCHEVFHAQDFLALVLREIKGIDVDRKQIYTDACGVNHFTWITKAFYQDINLLKLIPAFAEKYFEQGYYEKPGCDRFAFLTDSFAYGNKVKMDLFAKYGALAAAGDRHLAEFLPNDWYLTNPQTVKDWAFLLTTVPFRKQKQQEQINKSIKLASGELPIELKQSDEEAVAIMKALLGNGPLVTNVNLPNSGQMSQLPIGSIVETNCVFSHNNVSPVVSLPLPSGAVDWVQFNCQNIDNTFVGVKNRDLALLEQTFASQPLCCHLSKQQSHQLFKQMCYNTQEYLQPYFDLDSYFKCARKGN